MEKTIGKHTDALPQAQEKVAGRPPEFFERMMEGGAIATKPAPKPSEIKRIGFWRVRDLKKQICNASDNDKIERFVRDETLKWIVDNIGNLHHKDALKILKCAFESRYWEAIPEIKSLPQELQQKLDGIAADCLETAISQRHFEAARLAGNLSIPSQGKIIRAFLYGGYDTDLFGVDGKAVLRLIKNQPTSVRNNLYFSEIVLGSSDEWSEEVKAEILSLEKHEKNAACRLLIGKFLESKLEPLEKIAIELLASLELETATDRKLAIRAISHPAAGGMEESDFLKLVGLAFRLDEPWMDDLIMELLEDKEAKWAEKLPDPNFIIPASGPQSTMRYFYTSQGTLLKREGSKPLTGPNYRAIKCLCDVAEKRDEMIRKFIADTLAANSQDPSIRLLSAKLYFGLNGGITDDILRSHLSALQEMMDVSVNKNQMDALFLLLLAYGKFGASEKECLLAMSRGRYAIGKHMDTAQRALALRVLSMLPSEMRAPLVDSMFRSKNIVEVYDDLNRQEDEAGPGADPFVLAHLLQLEWDSSKAKAV
ncbi:MAG: hypothetical protein WC717_03535 [Candidatus Micrarchaeia archaeon]|jgi:hypothetical protein